jgi:ADP-ribosylglycohydrolase
MMTKKLALFLYLTTNVLFSAEQKKIAYSKITACIQLSAWAEALGNQIEQKNMSKKSQPAAIQWEAFFKNQSTPLKSFEDIQYKNTLWGFNLHPTNSLPYTDDSRMALLVGMSILQTERGDNDLVCVNILMSTIANNFIEDSTNPYGWNQPFRIPGMACKQALSLLKEKDKTVDNWWKINSECTDDKKPGGCGSVMRAYPFGLLFSSPIQAALLAVTHSEITHDAPMAKAACAAMAYGVSYLLMHKDSKNINNSTLINDVITTMYETTGSHDAQTKDEIYQAIGHSDTLIKLLTEKNISISDLFGLLFKTFDADDSRKSIIDFHKDIMSKYPGWNARDAICAVVYLFTLAKHCENTKELSDIVRLGVAHPGDSDSVGCMIGALIGAYAGRDAMDKFVKDDIKNLEGFIDGHQELNRFMTEVIEYNNVKDIYQFGKEKFRYSTTLKQVKPQQFVSLKNGLCVIGCLLLAYLFYAYCQQGNVSTI